MKKITFIIALVLCFTSELWAQKPFFNDLESNVFQKEHSLLIFYKPDCPYCIHLRNDFNSNPLFQKSLLEKYNVKLIDVTTIDGQQLAIKHKVQSIPFMISYSTKTSEEKRIKGYNSVQKTALFLNLNYTTSLNSRGSNAICGNGILESGEACDDGNVANNDGCESDCTVTPVISICGNGILESGEACDDGNIANNDGCESDCTVTPVISICGNGILESGEACDDGNVANNDGCESDCTVTPVISICGNGILESGEACDDGNVANNDGCESDCTVTPAISICGNGILESGEACDDGNVANNDGCQSDCTLAPLSLEKPNDFLNSIVMFPMPFRDSIAIKFLIDIPSDSVITVCNMTGQSLKRQTVSNGNDKNKEMEISGLESLSAGIYLLKIESSTGNFSQVKKIIKQ
ncbi:DUF4215 domain-containing protein [Flavobacterium sp. 25HG05S-40]|uniref:DUF4215 domain-containing protein n=1 Tax=Flavobacterium sp. 25HG05S-40 TaxID=3458682 RepID=UPI004043A34A